MKGFDGPDEFNCAQPVRRPNAGQKSGWAAAQWFPRRSKAKPPRRMGPALKARTDIVPGSRASPRPSRIGCGQTDRPSRQHTGDHAEGGGQKSRS